MKIKDFAKVFHTSFDSIKGERREVPPWSIVIPSSSSHAMLIYPDNEKGKHPTGVVIEVDPVKEIIHPVILHAFLCLPASIRHLQDMQSGAMKWISAVSLKEWDVPIPTNPENTKELECLLIATRKLQKLRLKQERLLGELALSCTYRVMIEGLSIRGKKNEDATD